MSAVTNSPPAKGEYPEGGRGFLPKLRFPEFRETGDWEERTLENACRMQAGKFVAASEIKDVNSGDLFPCYGGNGLRGYTATFTHDGIFPLIGRQGALCGNVKLAKGSFYATEHALVTIPKQDVHTEWLYYLLNRLNLNQYATGQAQPGLSVDVLNAIPIAIPERYGEQQKIADCLSYLDELSAAQARKVEVLKTHKKGLMQQLFPSEGETQPRLRFPEFRDAGEWAESKAGSFFTHRTTKGEQGLPIYSVTMNDGMVRRDSLDRKVDDIEDAAGNKKVCRNDIAYNMMRMWQGAMGVAPEDCLVSPAYVVLAPKKDAVPHFFQYLFKQSAMLQLLTSHSRGLTKDRLRLYFDDFAKMEFRCPTAKEQQRIADFLASIDARIATQTERLDTLKTHKKALMQQLFPAQEEVAA